MIYRRKITNALNGEETDTLGVKVTIDNGVTVIRLPPKEDILQLYF